MRARIAGMQMYTKMAERYGRDGFIELAVLGRIAEASITEHVEPRDRAEMMKKIRSEVKALLIQMGEP